MINFDKITDIFSIVDEFCKSFLLSWDGFMVDFPVVARPNFCNHSGYSILT